MIHKSVHSDLYGDKKRKLRGFDPNGQRYEVSSRQAVVALLVIIIMASWALDAMHVEFVPRTLHESIASFTDNLSEQLQESPRFAGFYSAVAHASTDGSPFTFGSVILLGILCAAGLAAKGTSGFLRARQYRN